MIVYLYILGALLLVFWVAYPLLKPAGDGIDGHGELLQERISSLLASLRGLYRTHEAGTLAESDFANIERRLLLDLARNYHALGVDPQKDAGQDLGAEIRYCPGCGLKREGDFRFCPQCGRGFHAA